MDLRRLAKGKPCQVRLVGICNHDPATTVLAHISRGYIGGYGMKAPDLCGVWACSDCHNAIDGRANVPRGTTEKLMLEADILAALCRTLSFVSKEL